MRERVRTRPTRDLFSGEPGWRLSSSLAANICQHIPARRYHHYHHYHHHQQQQQQHERSPQLQVRVRSAQRIHEWGRVLARRDGHAPYNVLVGDTGAVQPMQDRGDGADAGAPAKSPPTQVKGPSPQTCKPSKRPSPQACKPSLHALSSASSGFPKLNKIVLRKLGDVALYGSDCGTYALPPCWQRTMAATCSASARTARTAVHAATSASVNAGMRQRTPARPSPQHGDTGGLQGGVLQCTEQVLARVIAVVAAAGAVLYLRCGEPSLLQGREVREDVRERGLVLRIVHCTLKRASYTRAQAIQTQDRERVRVCKTRVLARSPRVAWAVGGCD